MDGGRIEGVMELVMRPWMATHAETQERLSAHLEGELRGREAKRVLRHLARCDHCREALRSLARALEGLRSLGRRDLASTDPSVADAVLDRIRREEPG
jgi:predicted anti-sigma-YlaC factor YlaD